MFQATHQTGRNRSPLKARDDETESKHLSLRQLPPERLKDFKNILNASYQQVDQAKDLKDKVEILATADEKGETNKIWGIHAHYVWY